MFFPNRRQPVSSKGPMFHTSSRLLLGLCGASALLVAPASGQAPAQPAKITIEQAIQLAIQHNHTLLANRTTIAQNQALEIQANVRPNPTLFTDWEYLPLVPTQGGLGSYLHDSTEGDLGLSYTFERGQKRQHRLQAAKDITAQGSSPVS